MNRTFFSLVVPAVFIAAAATAIWLFLNPGVLESAPTGTLKQTRLVTPQNITSPRGGGANGAAERMAYEDVTISKAALGDGEALISVITQDFDGDPRDEQMIAYRRASNSDGPIFIAYIDFDELSRDYRRVWNAETAATKGRTLGFYTKDLVGDRSVSVVVTGLNDLGEQTLTVFRKPRSPLARGMTFEKIVELRVDGSIMIWETERSQAYQLGLASGRSFDISTFERDYESTNILDQIEVRYVYDPSGGRYERSGTARIPGRQIEQRRVRDILDGTPERFESFLEGLWYYSGPSTAQGEQRFIFFDPRNREIIFYLGDSQEVFSWQNSGATRNGIYITSQNISVTTLRRLIDVELESMDSVQIQMFEQIRLRLGVTGEWNGSYTKASPANRRLVSRETSVDPWIDETYEGPMGRIRLHPDGSYGTTTENGTRRGRYAFFKMDKLELLEFRPQETGSSSREVYSVERVGDELVLSKVRIGMRGLEYLHQGVLRLRRLPDPN